VVIVIATLGAERARGRLRRGRPVAVHDPEASPIPLTRVTVVHPDPFDERSEALAWLQRTSADQDAAGSLTQRALQTLNKLLLAHRAATQDPYVPELSASAVSVTRLAVGSGDQLADGRWVEASELPAAVAVERRTRVGDIRPQERIAAVLGGKEHVDACETLLLRAHADFDQGREREGAIQLAAAIDTLLVELSVDEPPPRVDDVTDPELADGGSQPSEAPDGGITDPDHERDMNALRTQQGAIRSVAAKALGVELSAEDVDQARAALGVAERLLRRRRLTT
jgi:hypothetical protein